MIQGNSPKFIDTRAQLVVDAEAVIKARPAAVVRVGREHGIAEHQIRIAVIRSADREGSAALAAEDHLLAEIRIAVDLEVVVIDQLGVIHLGCTQAPWQAAVG